MGQNGLENTDIQVVDASHILLVTTKHALRQRVSQPHHCLV